MLIKNSLNVDLVFFPTARFVLLKKRTRVYNQRCNENIVSLLLFQAEIKIVLLGNDVSGLEVTNQ